MPLVSGRTPLNPIKLLKRESLRTAERMDRVAENSRPYGPDQRNIPSHSRGDDVFRIVPVHQAVPAAP